MIQKDIQIQFKKLFQKIETKDDVLEILNLAKSCINGNEVIPIKLSSLTYFSNPGICKNRYNSFTIKKKNGRERLIHSPVYGLKDILHCLNFILQCVHNPHHAAFGFVPEKSIVDNASQHISSRFVYNIDLKDFFHSFDRNAVKLAFMREPFFLNKEKEPIAFLLSCLCTHNLNDKKKFVLPQGSPTSPTLTNILCVKLDHRLSGLAKRFGCKYSRYADDITFSANKNVFKNHVFINELNRIIEDDQKLKNNPSKTRLQSNLYRQEVTGLVVNQKVNVKKRYIKSLRMWLHFWEKYGYQKTRKIFYEYYKADKINFTGTPSLDYVIKGKIDFLKMVKGNKNSTCLKLENRFKKLTPKSNLYKKTSDIDKVVDAIVNKGLSSGIKMFNKLYN